MDWDGWDGSGNISTLLCVLAFLVEHVQDYFGSWVDCTRLSVPKLAADATGYTNGYEPVIARLEFLAEPFRVTMSMKHVQVRCPRKCTHDVYSQFCCLPLQFQLRTQAFTHQPASRRSAQRHEHRPHPCRRSGHSPFPEPPQQLHSAPVQPHSALVQLHSRLAQPHPLFQEHQLPQQRQQRRRRRQQRRPYPPSQPSAEPPSPPSSPSSLSQADSPPSSLPCRRREDHHRRQRRQSAPGTPSVAPAPPSCSYPLHGPGPLGKRD